MVISGNLQTLDAQRLVSCDAWGFGPPNVLNVRACMVYC